MNLCRVLITAQTASFRYPNFISSNQLSLKAIPYTTIAGLVASATGDDKLVDFKFSYTFRYLSSYVDLETIYKFEKKGESVNNKNVVQDPTFKREILYDCYLTLYFEEEQIANAFKSPIFQLLLGRSGDLVRVLEVKKIKANNVDMAIINGTIIPFKKIVPGEIYAMPKNFDYSRRVRIPRQVQPFLINDGLGTFIHHPTNKLEAFDMNNWKFKKSKNVISADAFFDGGITFFYIIKKFMLAKSDGTTIEQHVQELLDVFNDFMIAFPAVKKLFKNDRFWKYLRLTIIFHDIGKATKGFQDLMRDKKRYRFRHEVLSAIIAQNYFNNELIINAILAHHKNFNCLKELFREYENNKKYNQDRWIGKEFKDLDIQWIRNYLNNYNFVEKELKLGNLDKTIKKWTSRRDRQNILEQEKFQNIFLSASLSICDHNASAGIKNIPIIEPDNFKFLSKIKKSYYHQQISWNIKGNALLIAPTGKGKTESALGWLKNQLQYRQGRAFYILPFTASINAMTKRVSGEKQGFGDETIVGLLHGKAKFFIEEYYEKKDGQSLKDLIDINKKIIKPFKVVTPFQILKWAFGVKGFEKGLTELAGSYLIFDEIHIYDRDLFERILFFLEWLIEKLDVKVFIMTATMPSFMQEYIKSVLKIEKEIRPNNELIDSIKRHKIKLLNSNIDKQIDFIQSKIKLGKNVLVVCNTVAKAQKMYEATKCNKKILLHSGFNAKDRTQKEKEIQLKNKPQLLVGTQAIEVSLDIDYDLIVTEPAPLDALLQRFGRVFRGKDRMIQENDNANCFVTTEITNAHKYIYEESLIVKTLEELKKIEGTLVCENKIQNMLDIIYEPFELDSDLKENFRNYLDGLYPYNIYEENEEDFFSQFDGIEVLPIELFNNFSKFVETQRFLEAEKLFVSISKSRYMQMLNKHKIYSTDIINYKQKVYLINVKYCSETGLNFDKSVEQQFL